MYRIGDRFVSFLPRVMFVLGSVILFQNEARIRREKSKLNHASQRKRKESLRIGREITEKRAKVSNPR